MKKTIQNKNRCLHLGITMLISLAYPIISYGMESDKEERQEFFKHFGSLPMRLQEKIHDMVLQEKIRKLKTMQNAIDFLALQPISLKGHKDVVNSVAIAEDKVITGSWDKTAMIWDINTGQLLHTLKGHEYSICSATISDNTATAAGKEVMTVSQNDTAKIWNLDGQCYLTLKGHTGWIDSIATSGRKVVTGSSNGTIKIGYMGGQLLHTLKGHTYAVKLIALSHDKFVSTDGEIVKIWNLDGQLLCTLEGYIRCSVKSIGINYDKVVIGACDGTAMIWDMSKRLLHTLLGHTYAVSSVAISNDKVATGSNEGKVKIWSTNGHLLHTFEEHKPLGSVAIRGNKVVTGLFDGTAHIWDIDPFSGTAKSNPLLWIIENATIPRLDFLIKEAYESTSAKQEFIIEFPSENARLFLKLPKHVQQYLLARLQIRRPTAQQPSSCLIQ